MQTKNNTKEKRWVEIRERGTKKMIGIYYNPYCKPTRYVIAWWVEPDQIKTVYGIRKAY